ncbi:MAG: LytTR family DNA-binding domain-containing protein [Chitinophagaceae bacterium]
MQSQYLHNRFNILRQKPLLLFILLLPALLVVTVLQDYLQAQYHHFAFYFSESILFKIFWVLFLPVSILQLMLFNRQQYLTGTLSKIFFFVISSTILHMLLFAILIYGLSALFFNHTYSIAGTLSYTIAEDIYKYLLIYTATGLLYFRGHVPLSQNNTTVPEPSIAGSIDKIFITAGRNNTVVAVKDILYILSSSPYIAIHTAHKKHLQQQTLKSIAGQLDNRQFARIHKSAIVNIQKVTSYTSRLNGDYDVTLENGEQLRLSRNYAANFKHCMESKSSA